MSESQIKTIIIVALAFTLGLTFSTQPASGYPAGAAVSKGTNPIFSKGGELSSSGPTTIVAPDDADLIITDVVLTNGYGNIDVVTMREGASGPIHGKFQVMTYSSMARHIELTYESGIRIEAGETLSIYSSGQVYYSLSGYHAQP